MKLGNIHFPVSPLVPNIESETDFVNRAVSGGISTLHNSRGVRSVHLVNTCSFSTPET